MTTTDKYVAVDKTDGGEPGREGFARCTEHNAQSETSTAIPALTESVARRIAKQHAEFVGTQWIGRWFAYDVQTGRCQSDLTYHCSPHIGAVLLRVPVPGNRGRTPSAAEIQALYTDQMESLPHETIYTVHVVAVRADGQRVLGPASLYTDREGRYLEELRGATDLVGVDREQQGIRWPNEWEWIEQYVARTGDGSLATGLNTEVGA